MGTGKSTVGRLVAEQLGFSFFDTDHWIEAQHGRSVSDIFQLEGEEQFRRYEGDAIRHVAAKSGLVISTGGGLVTRSENLEELKKHSAVICLWASPETILGRIGDQTHRPLLRTADPSLTIRELLAKREPMYRNADALVNSDQRTLREVCQQVIHQFRLLQSFPR